MSNKKNENNFAELFGTYDKNNIGLLENHINVLDECLKGKYNFCYPFFKGNYDFKFYDYVKNCKLNFEGMNSHSCLNYMSQLFQCLPNWNNPGTMINIIPPVNLVSLAVSTVGNMYNSNFAQDTYAGFLIASELEVSKYISELVGWDWETSGGLFTFGGKGTNLYATKIAINKLNPQIREKGIDKKVLVFTTSTGHPCHKQVCNWLGIGESNCIEIKCNANGTISIEEFEKNFRKYVEANYKIACINLNGGNTNDLVIDPIDKVKNLIDSLTKEYNLDYIPHIHVDSVIGWVYLFFTKYDFDVNPLNIKQPALSVIRQNANFANKLVYADSIGVDFHKTGFCPYNSSLFLIKDHSDFVTLTSKPVASIKDISYGDYNPYEYTLELSRSSAGALSALASIKSLGICGFQTVIKNINESVQEFKRLLKKRKDIVLLNEKSNGFATLFIIVPKTIIISKIEDIETLSKEEIGLIQKYNIGFSSFLLKKCLNNQSNIYFTSSRSFSLPNSNVKVGALKAYPASPFLESEMISRIVSSISKSIDEYNTYENEDISKYYILKDDMVYGG